MRKIDPRNPLNMVGMKKEMIADKAMQQSCHRSLFKPKKEYIGNSLSREDLDTPTKLCWLVILVLKSVLYYCGSTYWMAFTTASKQVNALTWPD